MHSRYTRFERRIRFRHTFPTTETLAISSPQPVFCAITFGSQTEITSFITAR